LAVWSSGLGVWNDFPRTEPSYFLNFGKAVVANQFVPTGTERRRRKKCSRFSPKIACLNFMKKLEFLRSTY
jgi:hypothetical protein